MRKFIYSAVGAAALAMASLANAAVIVTAPSPAVYTPPATGGFIGLVTPSAGANASTMTGFNDTFNFDILGSPGLTDAQVSTVLLNGIQNISFSSVMLDGNAFTRTSIDGAAEQWSCCGPTGLLPVLLAPGPHTINLIGTLTGNLAASYSGTLNVQVAPVPEPATWAMMLIGFAGVGMAMRRRRRPALAQLA